jgi:manganese/zinc/iron transport system substrate-binding protein
MFAKLLPKWTAVWAVAFAVVAIGCGPGQSPDSADEAAGDARIGPLKVTTTIGMIADVARNIAGEHAEVTALMGPGVDPHLYKAKVSDLKSLGEADVILYNGIHLEGKMADTLVDMSGRVATVRVTESVPEELLREPPEFAGQYDPHIWFDVSMWKYCAERIRDALIEHDPEHADVFSANAEAYLAKMDELHAYAQTRLAEVPESERILVTAHDAFGYFGQAYGVEVLGIQGISTASEAGLQDIGELIHVIVDRGVKAVFVESSVSRKSVDALVAGVQGNGHDIKVGGELFSDAMGEDGTLEGTYIGMVRHNVDTIVNALK